MAFSSSLFVDEVIIDDATPNDVIFHPGGGRGYNPDMRPRSGYQGRNLAKPVPKSLLVPRPDWEGWIKEMEETKTRVSDRILQTGLPFKNQKSTNYCWGAATVAQYETIRMLMNQPYVSLSPASVCAPIKNFTNQGGWGGEALEWMIRYGIFPTRLWPDAVIDRRYFTREGKEAALDYRPTEWWELEPRNFEELFSLLLRRIPCSVGRNWWEHQTMDCDPVWLDGAPAIRTRNQWDVPPWNQNHGFGIIRGIRCNADDGVASTLAMAA
jgi:hypothetical protein